MKLNEPLTDLDTRVIPHKIKTAKLEVEALTFLGAKSDLKNLSAIFTHGYTASKASVFNWALRLADSGVTTTIFDLPGHFLGSFNEVDSLDTFVEESPHLFEKAYEAQKIFAKQYDYQLDFEEVILGGHSLGALVCLKALQAQLISAPKRKSILVGFGLNSDVKTHFFDTPFFKKTLNIRRQLVCESLESQKVFSWIKSQKESLLIKNEDIVLLAGDDDIVIGKNGAETLMEKLSPNNNVKLIKPKNLSHHQPELAASYIYNHLKKVYSWKK